MTGTEFYNYLRKVYYLNGQVLYGNYTFHSWLYKPRGNSYSFQFNIKSNNRKAIPKEIIIEAWEANQVITNDWIIQHFNVNFHKDCRLYMLNFLLKTNINLR